MNADDIALTEDQTTYRARQARYWRQQEHLLRMEFLHDLADRCAARAEEWELEPAWTASEVAA